MSERGTLYLYRERLHSDAIYLRVARMKSKSHLYGLRLLR